MSATIWIDTEKEETIELGGTVQAYQAVAEIAKSVGSSFPTAYPNLYGVMDAVETQEDVDPEWLTQAKNEANSVLAKFGSKLSANAVSFLDALVSG